MRGIVWILLVFLATGCSSSGCKKYGTRTIYFDYCGDRKNPTKEELRRQDYLHKL